MNTTLRRPLALSLSFAAACGQSQDDGPTDTGTFEPPEIFPVLIDSQVIPSGDAECPTGGVRIRTGLDDGSGDGTANDGILQEGEVTATTTVCEGQSGTVGEPGGTLVRYEAVLPGEEGCSDGGVRILVGEDDGANGGVANDGRLQDGEVRNTSIVCADPDPFSFLPGPDAPGGPAGTAEWDFSGGAGNENANGGDGGEGYMGLRQPDAGFLRAHTTGSVDTSFTVPTPRHDFGTQKVDITTDTTVETGWPDNLSELADGDLFIDGNRMYVVEDGSARQVTGLEVAPGATLTLSGSSSGGIQPRIVQPVSGVNLVFSNSIRIQGTVRLAPGLGGGSLTLRAPLIDVSGTVDVSSENGGGTLQLSNEGRNRSSILVTGTLDARCTGDDGSGGDVSLYGSRAVYLDGAIHVDAALQDVNRGNSAGAIEIEADAVYLAGSVSGRGGTAGGDGSQSSSGHGGDGGFLYVWARQLVSSLDVQFSAGDGSSSCAPSNSCRGGFGGQLFFQTEPTSAVRVSGSWQFHGGAGFEAGNGGDGGEGTVYLGDRWSSGTSGRPNARAGLTFGASVAARGGNAGSEASRAGEGGRVRLESFHSSGQPADLRVLGLASIRAHGGTGRRGGWGGGAVANYETSDWSGSGGPIFLNNSSVGNLFPTGISWDVPVQANGGEGLSDGGGRGGTFFAVTPPYGDPSRRDVTATLNHQLNGGQGTWFGGEGGFSVVGSGTGSAKIQGTVVANGGASSLATGGGGGGVIAFGEAGDLDVNLDVSLHGGDGAEGGGWGGYYAAEGGVVDFQGSIGATGGDATSDGDGGEGGYIEVTSFAGTSSTSSASVQTAGGAGAGGGEAGREGVYFVDGVPR